SPDDRAPPAQDRPEAPGGRVIRDRFLGASHAFDHPVSKWIAIGVGAAIVFALLIIALLSAVGVVKDNFRKELWKRTLAWAVMAPMMIVPVLLGPGWAVVAVTILSLACYSEFARATGLFREKLVSAVVALGI